MPALIAIAIFPVLTLLLVALTKTENMLGNLAENASEDLAPAPLSLVAEVTDAPSGDALPVPGPNLRLVEAEEHLAA
jgi:hypothetical protein